MLAMATRNRKPPGRNDESDGKNENFLLAKFTPQGEGTRERIVDDEVFEWLKQADAKGVRVVFVADSCHSGTMHRSARADSVRFRNGKFGKITDDLLEFSPPESAKLTEQDFENITFVGATSEDRLTPEVVIDGKPRGALSWAFSRALEGRADKNGDGEISQVELLGFIVPAVHAHVQGQQTPQVQPQRARSVRLVALKNGSQSPQVKTGSDFTSVKRAGADQLRVALEGGSPDLLRGIPHITVVTNKADADVIWEAATGRVEHVVGGLVAENVQARQLPYVLGKWSALKWLNGIATNDPIVASLPRGQQRYAVGETVELVVKGARYPYLTMFNLPPNGRVEFFIPSPRNPREATQDWRKRIIHEKFKVTSPPYGAEHMVAVFSDTVLRDLHASLATMTTPERATGLRNTLMETLTGLKFQVGIVNIYTGNAP